MRNYYSLLEVEPTASTDEIKKAFRKKLKQFHPDAALASQEDQLHMLDDTTFAHTGYNTSPLSSENVIVDIITASRVLLNPQKRRLYDASLHPQYSTIPNQYYNTKKSPRVFNYEKFLEKRQHIFAYKAKLFLYDIMRQQGERAAKIYNELEQSRTLLLLQKHVGWYNFFDSVFLIAEYYHMNITHNISYSTEAVRLYMEVGRLEKIQSYFKDYIDEVADRILWILTRYPECFTTITRKTIVTEMQTWNISRAVRRKVK